MAGVMAGRLYQWSSTHGPRMKYVYPEQYFDWAKAAGMSYASYFVLFNGIIPLAMIITLEFAKITYSHVMEQDVDMINFETAKNLDDLQETRVQNLTLIEQLGNVSCILCDKTGTIT